jgi:hypothetical protein
MPLARAGNARADVSGVGKPPRDETARWLGLGVGAMRLWRFEDRALIVVVSAIRQASGRDGGELRLMRVRWQSSRSVAHVCALKIGRNDHCWPSLGVAG